MDSLEIPAEPLSKAAAAAHRQLKLFFLCGRLEQSKQARRGMKRHHVADMPLAAAGGGGGVREEKAADRLGKGYNSRRCSRLCSLLVLSATVSMLALHFYDYGRSAAGAGARVEHGSSWSSLHGARKVDPIASRYGRPQLSGPSAASPPPPLDDGDHGKPLPASGEETLPSAASSGSSAAGPGGDSRGKPLFARALASAEDRTDPCGGRYIYVQELPPRFNTDLVRDCGKLSPWMDKCQYTANGGFGPKLGGDGDGALQETGWYKSDEHMLDIIFHNRIKQYGCLTNDSSLAAAVFVPFYAGLDVARHLWGHNVSTRDAMALEMVDLVTARPEWRTMGGRDHFFVAGRTTWDFRRQGNGDAEWGNKFFRLPAVQNMTALVVEASPWHLNDAAVPYPTAFHPATDESVLFWQDRVRGLDRRWLFSFAGAPRQGGGDADAMSVASQLVDQCAASASCSLMECRKGPSNRCDSPAAVMELFQSSTFCLQPQGDTYTGRSAFEAILAGCIPVFFHPGTAYVQYTWHLPARSHAEYSVYIPEEDVRANVSVEERLRQIPPDAVGRMRNAVVRLIPAVIYTDPSSKLESTVTDAFDVAVDAVIGKVTKLRRGVVEGRAEEEKLPMYGWKYPLLGEGQSVEDPHQWDPLFAFN